MRLLSIGLIAGLGLTGCVTAQNPDAAASCKAPQYQYLVGRPLAEFHAAKVTGTVRILGPNSVMTMDHLPWRLNVNHDKRNIINGISCG